MSEDTCANYVSVVPCWTRMYLKCPRPHLPHAITQRAVHTGAPRVGFLLGLPTSSVGRRKASGCIFADSNRRRCQHLHHRVQLHSVSSCQNQHGTGHNAHCGKAPCMPHDLLVDRTKDTPYTGKCHAPRNGSCCRESPVHLPVARVALV